MVMVSAVCQSVCVSRANISETKRHRPTPMVIKNSTRKPGFPIQNLPLDLNQKYDLDIWNVSRSELRPL